MTQIGSASPADLSAAGHALAAAFADDPITGFLLQTGAGYPERLRQFFLLLMRARIALHAPVLVARAPAGIVGAVMGYDTRRDPWPDDIAQAWDRFEAATPGLTTRMAVYDDIAARFMPPLPHHYLGAIGVAPPLQGQGVGTRLLQAFCERSAADLRSHGVYLETAKASNLGLYERAGFVRCGKGTLGDAPLWCLYLSHGRVGTGDVTPGA